MADLELVGWICYIRIILKQVVERPLKQIRVIPQSFLVVSFLSHPIATFGSPSNETDQLAKEALDVGLTSAQSMVNYLSSIPRQADPCAVVALNDNVEAFGTAAGRIRNSLKQMLLLISPSSSSFRLEINNVLTWIAGAIDDGDTCTEGFKEVAEGPLKTDISNRVEDYKKVIENALALVRTVAEKQAP